jgi:hypothetical protein
MLPMVVCGLAANLVAALIQHKVSNKLLVGIGAGAYLVSFILAAAQRHGDSYWAFTFPAFCICVVGADFQFIVANVSFKSNQLRASVNFRRCMCSHRCLQTSSPLLARFYKLSRVYAPLSGMALLLPSLMVWRITHPTLGIMPIMLSNLSPPCFGSRPGAHSLAHCLYHS